MKILFPAKRGELASSYATTCRGNKVRSLIRGRCLFVEIKAGWIKIILKDKKNILDELSFLEERNLSEKLLPTIDKLLKKNKLQPQDIKDFQVVSDLGENYTTYRLAETVAQSFLFALKER